jgi:RNA methyltransferase, TrmH family
VSGELLGPRHVDVRRLRALLRDPAARATERRFVVEGPRAVEGALDRGVPLERLFVGPGAERSFAPLVARARAGGVPVDELKDGVLERVGTTVTPQPVLAIAPVPHHDTSMLTADGLVLVAVEIGDPGNLGTLLRSAEAAGAAGIVLGAGSVDAYNPKVVRASAGAIFGVPLLEGWSVMDALHALREAGRACYGSRAVGGSRPDDVDLAAPAAVLLGHEVRGLTGDAADDARLDAHLDGWVTIPVRPPVDSINVAMAGTVLCFEAARQRARAGGPDAGEIR